MTAQAPTVHVPRRAFPWGKLAAWIALGILLVVTLFPFYWMLRTALTFPTSVYKDTGSLLPVDATLINFKRVLGMLPVQQLVELGGTGQSINFFLALRNSIIVSVLTVIGQVAFCAMAAYAFARLRFPFRNQIFAIYIAAMMVPGIVMTIPNFIFIRNMGWIDTFQGIVAPGFLMTPFAIFFLRQFFLGVNREVEEAALIDGASIPTVFFKVVLPMTIPAVTTLAVIVFIGSWNNYMWPLIVAKEESVRVLTVALGVFRSQTPQGAPDWSGLMAATTLSIIPTFILFLFAGRKILDSIQFSGFK